ncbi:MAG: LysR family transcriptional regulator [Bacillota bacterium]|nr:LysR family transcriptional regulator [Bacillota bacterium]
MNGESEGRVNGVRLDHLRCFEAVKNHQCFSVAAENLYMSQSALSKQLKALENELGAVLFSRKHAAVHLTPVGERICIYVETILDAYDKMVQEVKDYTASENRKLRVASFYDMAQYGVTNLIIGFEREQADFHVESRECDHTKMLHLLDDRETDIVIGYREFWPQQLDYYVVPLRRDELVLVVHESHRLAPKSSISLSDVRHEKFCFPREDGALFKLFYDACMAAGFVPKLTLSDVRLGTIKQYIRAGMRVTLQTRIRAANVFYEPDFRLIDIQETPLLTVTILTNKNLLSRLGWEFIQYAYGFYNNMAQAGIGVTQ